MALQTWRRIWFVDLLCHKTVFIERTRANNNLIDTTVFKKLSARLENYVFQTNAHNILQIDFCMLALVFYIRNTFRGFEKKP